VLDFYLKLLTQINENLNPLFYWLASINFLFNWAEKNIIRIISKSKMSTNWKCITHVLYGMLRVV